jgi:hypothetical protein
VQGVMISCFDHSTIMAQPWADAGYLCYCVDIQHPRGESRKGNIIRVGADINAWLPPKAQVAFAAFFPPCTDVARSGGRWFRDKGLGALIGALQGFKRSIDLAELIGAPYMIENPVGMVSTYWRKPDHKFDPCDYGDPYTKRTHLWTGNGFVMPPKTPVKPEPGSAMRDMLRTPDRQKIRSLTPPGFARAVYLANAPHLSVERVHA